MNDEFMSVNEDEQMIYKTKTGESVIAKPGYYVYGKTNFYDEPKKFEIKRFIHVFDPKTFQPVTLMIVNDKKMGEFVFPEEEIMNITTVE